MAFPLTTVLGAAPGLISAAADVIRVIKERKQKQPEQPVKEDDPYQRRFEELEAVIEQQAKVIEELALNNHNLTLAVRNNRILCFGSLFIALFALILGVAKV